MLSKEQTQSTVNNTSWQKWHMDSIDKPKEELPASNGVINSIDEEQELKNNKQSIFDKAQKDGFQQGHKSGYEAGFNDAKDAGFSEGYEKGILKGQEDGQKSGYESGFNEGLDKGLEKAQAEVKRLEELFTECLKSINNLEEDIGQNIIELSIGIAQKILKTELNANPELILNQIKQALDKDTTKNCLEIRLNPEDLSIVKKYINEQIKRKDIKLIEDEKIERGGCVAQTEFATHDMRLKTRWLRAISALGYLPKK